MRSAVTGLSVCLLLLLQVPVFAGEDMSGDWDPVSAGPYTTWTAPMVGKGSLAVQPIAVYSRTRGTFNDEGHYVAFSDGEKASQFQQQLFAQYGITDKWEVDLQVIYQENYATDTSGNKTHDQGWGDALLFTRYELIEEKAWLPQISGLLQVKMPTGKYQKLDPAKNESDSMGSGSWDPAVGINLTKKFKPFMFHADAVMNFPQDVKIDGVNTRYANYLNYDAAVEYFLPRGFNLMFEVNGLYQGNTKQDGVKDPSSDARSLTLAPGIGWSNDSIQALLAYQRTVSGRNVDAVDALVATFVYTF